MGATDDISRARILRDARFNRATARDLCEVARELRAFFAEQRGMTFRERTDAIKERRLRLYVAR